MKYYDWSPEKNILLKAVRGVCFEDIVAAINGGNTLAVTDHPQKKKYPNQRIYIVNLFGYAYLIPFVESGEKIFLKTIIPSRRATAKYLTHKKKLL